MKKYIGEIILIGLICITCILYLAPKPHPKSTADNDNVHLRLDPTTKRYSQASDQLSTAEVALKIAQHNYQTYQDMQTKMGNQNEVKNEFNPTTKLTRDEIQKGLAQTSQAINGRQKDYQNAKHNYKIAVKDYNLNHDKMLPTKVRLS